MVDDGGNDRSEEERRRDRQMLELLNELRVALPGVQILFAFLLTVPFAQRFSEVSDFQRNLFFATLIATAVSATCLIAPTATHRLRFHQSDRAYVIESSHRLTIAGLVFLAVAMMGAVLLITDFIYDGTVVWLGPSVVTALLVVLWFARPLARQTRGKSSGP
jgi:hypothetical protein